MSTPILTQCGCPNCANQIRSVYGSLEGGGDPTYMLAWVNSVFDSSIATVPWGEAYWGQFNDPTSPTPFNIASLPCNVPECMPLNDTLCPNGSGLETGGCGEPVSTPCDVPDAQRTQYYLPFGPDYFVVAVGTAITGAEEFEGYDENCSSVLYNAVACSYAGTGLPTLIDLPIPDNSGAVDSATLVSRYILGIFDPGVSSVPNINDVPIPIMPVGGLPLMTLANQSPILFGSNWAASLENTCHAAPADPFTGSNPP